MLTLTAAEQDYIEIIHRLTKDGDSGNVRISDIAAGLGTRMPTVTRTVRKLTDRGILAHPYRGSVSLSDSGKRIAAQLQRRHNDLVRFLTDVLGLDEAAAVHDTCRIKHGLSRLTSRRLHEFMEHFHRLDDGNRQALTVFAQSAGADVLDFRHLPESPARSRRIVPTPEP